MCFTRVLLSARPQAYDRLANTARLYLQINGKIMFLSVLSLFKNYIQVFV